MRRLLDGDVHFLARHLFTLHPDERATRARKVMREADLGDDHRRRFGRPHPLYGGGSLMAAASRYPRGGEGNMENPDWRHCLRAILDEMDRREAAFARRVKHMEAAE